MGLQFNEEEIRKAIAILKPDGQPFEVRIIEDRWNMAGYFRDADTLIRELSSPRIHPGAQVYFSLNAINEACYDRKARDRFVESMKPTVSDTDVEGYDWLLIDVDPKRPSGTGSTEAQVRESREKARQIYHYLQESGWCDPVVAHSGNGTHLLYGINLDNQKEQQLLVQNCLKALNMMFSDSAMEVDLTTFNPSRVCKLYGTVARKGANTKERPHRLSRILQVPKKLERTPRAYLEKLAAALPQEEAPQEYNGYNPRKFDLQVWIDQHQIAVAEKSEWQGGTRWILDHCPFNEAHNHKDACIIQTRDGKICFNCFHNSCADKHWREFRTFFEPEAYQKKEDPLVPNYVAGMPEGWAKRQEAKEKQQTASERMVSEGLVPPPDLNPDLGPDFLTTEEIRLKPAPQEAFIKTGIDGVDLRMIGLKKTFVTALSGLRSSGKSDFLSQLVIECRQQGLKVALFSGEMSDKQILKWMTLQAAGKQNVHGTQYPNVFYPEDWAAERISRWLNEYVYIYNNDYGNQYSELYGRIKRIVKEKQLDIVLIDNLMALDIRDLDRDMYARQSAFVLSLKELAKEMNIHVLFVAHPRKAQGYLKMDDISGSADLTNAVDNVFIIHRVDDDFKQKTREYYRWKADNPIYRAGNVLEICKDRDFGYRDVHIPLYFEKETKRLRNSETENKKYGWEVDPATGLPVVTDEDVPF